MASLRMTRAGTYIVCFRLDGRQHQRSLRTKDAAEAKAVEGRVEHAVYKLSIGEMSVPAGVDPVEFIVWGEAAVKKAEKAVEAKGNGHVPSLTELIEPYLRDQRGLKADSTLQTEQTHLRNLLRYLGERANLPVDQISDKMLNRFIQHREQNSRPITVIKERQTIASLFAWIVKGERGLHESPATNLRRPQAGVRRDEFRTIDEVEEIVDRGGLTDEEELQYWESLFLTEEEIGAVLSVVWDRAAHDFIYPMFALAAYTGMRRGEIVARLRWSDVNFRHKVITARSKKQSRQEEETSRKITLHPDLERILLEYKGQRPAGQHVICLKNTLKPLTVSQAHDHFQRTLRGAAWERALPSGKKLVIISFHTFRHSFATNLAMGGVDQRFIDKWMGHQTKRMQERYQHLRSDKLAEEIRKLSFRREKDQDEPDTGLTKPSH